MRTSFVVIVVAVLAPGGAFAQDSKETKEVTEIGGRTIEQWIKDITHKDPSKRENAVRSVMSFGPEKAYQAVPAMLTELRRHTPDSPIDTSVRVTIAMALGPILAAQKKPDPKVVKDAVTLLTRLLRDSQGIVKYRAAQALAMLGSDARPATADMLPLLRDKLSWEVRQTGAMALGSVAVDRSQGPPPFVITALQILFSDAAFHVRQSSCQAIVMLGPPLDASLKFQTLKMLEPLAKKDAEPVVQIWANMAIMVYTGKIADANLEQITQLLHKGDVATRVQAAQALGAVGPLAKEIVPALIGALSDPDTNVKGFTIMALGRMESLRAVPALEKLAADAAQPEDIKKAANEAVKQIKKGSAK